MTRNLPLPVLRQKIQELETALFFVISDELLKMPARIIRAICVDDLGQIWFFLPLPTQSVKEFSQVFLSRLDFFKKQKEYSLSVTGRAFFVIDPEELNTAEAIPATQVQQAIQGEGVLVKLIIQKVDYQEKKLDHKDLIHAWKSDFRHILGRALTFLPRFGFPALKDSLLIRSHQMPMEWIEESSNPRETERLNKLLIKKPRSRKESIAALHEA